MKTLARFCSSAAAITSASRTEPPGLSDRRGADVDPTQPPSVPELTPTLSSIQSLVFTPQCVTHHGDSEAEAGLNLEEGKSFAALVNVPSTQVALDLVEPNGAEDN